MKISIDVEVVHIFK